MKVIGDQIDLNLLGWKTLKGCNAKKGDKTWEKKTNVKEIQSNSDC